MEGRMISPGGLTVQILSLQVGLPRWYGQEGAESPMARPWQTGAYKEPVMGPVWLGSEGLDGDGVADRRVHGGPEKALLACSAGHYPLWRTALGLELPFGAFGENATVTASEADVCIGDVYAVGTAVVAVSQPRQPCWKMARRWGITDLAVQMQDTGRTGWYFRVRQAGHLRAGDIFVLQDRPFPEWSIAAANAVMHGPAEPATLAALATCPGLAAGWQRTLMARVQTGMRPDSRPRLIGPNDP
jgi:MOSC domain-containing protein YiiM